MDVGDQVVFLLGPTATGKTALGVALAQRLDAEIISVDSSLVYRHMTIGTAKPDMAERGGIPHHLIDIREPADAYSVAEFCNDVQNLVPEIQARGRLPLLVGGTMLYFKALNEGLAPLPAADPAVRKQLAGEAQQIGWPAMHEQLAAVDAKASARIHPNDPQRIQRALEVVRLTGKTMTELQEQSIGFLSSEPVCLGLMPTCRSWLHARIEQRFDAMLEAGFLDEMRGLMFMPTTSPEQPAMRSVGYRQAWQHLSGETDAITFRDHVLAATRQLAKRQMTWMRSMQPIDLLACDEWPLEQQLTQCVERIEAVAQ